MPSTPYEEDHARAAVGAAHDRGLLGWGTSALRFLAAVAELTALDLPAAELVERFLQLVSRLDGVVEAGFGARALRELEIRATAGGGTPGFGPGRRRQLPPEVVGELSQGEAATWEERPRDGRGPARAWLALPVPSRWMRGGILVSAGAAPWPPTVVEVLVRAAAVLAARLDALALIDELTEMRRRAGEGAGRREREASRWAHIFQHAGWGIATLSPIDGRIEHVNPAFARMHGFEPRQLVGRLVIELVAPSERGRMHALHGRLAEREVVTIRTVHRRADGTEFPVVANVSLVHGDGGHGDYVAVHLRDVTERQRLEEELRHAQRLESVGRLAGGVAHDFNNILSTIIGYSELALLEVAPGSVLESYISSIHVAGERAAALTAQLLAFSRRQVLDPSVVELSALVREVVDMVRRVIGEDIRLALDLSQTPLEVDADPAQLQQVVMNLLVNARDAMPTGGRLGVATSRRVLSEADAEPCGLSPGPFAVISVVDDGVGMSPEVREHIFEPFFTTKPASEGTGLGLSTSYGIVRQHGGVIEVDSTPGVGSEFRVLLPLHGGARRPPRDEPVRAGVNLAGDERVLVVDDLEDIRDLVAALLEPLGYTVEGASSAEEAIERLADRATPIDVVLTDVVLTGRSGLDLARAVERAGLDWGPAVVLMSGYSDARAAREDASQAGFVYLSKPLDGRRLALAIREAVRRAQLPRHA